MSLKKQFNDKVLECLKKAEEIYEVSFGDVDISYSLSGRTAGYALRRGTKFSLKFNAEAILDNWDNMIESTIPHEVAHLVAFAKPILGARNHNHAWRRIAIALGDTDNGSRCHNYTDLSPGRRTKKYIYRFEMAGEIEVSSILHNRISKGRIYKLHKTGEVMTRDKFTGKIKQ